MRKITLMTALMLICSMAWGLNPDIKAKRTLADAGGGVWTYMEDEGLLTDESQITVNSVQLNDGGGVYALIDEDESSYFHSAYSSNSEGTAEDGTGLVNEPHWFEVDLGAPYSSIFIRYVARNSSYHDSPSDMTVLGKVGEEWKEIARLDSKNAKNPIPARDANVWEWNSGKFDLGGEYQVLRFVVNKTHSGRSNADTHNYCFWTMAELQIYEAQYIVDQAILLTQLVDSITKLNLTFDPGTDPGQYDETAVIAYEDAFNDAMMAQYEDHTDEEYKAYADGLRAALAAVRAAQIQVEDGYYYWISADGRFFAQQEVEKAVFCKTDHTVWWGDFTEECERDPNFIFQITKTTDKDGEVAYAFYNYGTEEYIVGHAQTSKPIPTSKELEVLQYIHYESGFLTINSGLNASSYHCGGHDNGAGTSSKLMQWGGASAEPSRWYLRKITDETIIADLEAAKRQLVLDAALEEALDIATENYNMCFSYKVTDKLITSVDQLSCNVPETAEGEGDLYSLIDEDRSTYFHSIYSWSDYGAVHNLQVDLLSPLRNFIYEFQTRTSGGSTAFVPVNMTVYATNDDELGADATSPNDQWTKIMNLNEAYPVSNPADYFSTGIDLGAPYRYVRFLVNATLGSLQGTGTNNYTGNAYYALGEFQMYKYTIDEENSQYSYVEGMKEAAEKLNELIIAKRSILNNNKSTTADVEELDAAVKALRALVADPSEFIALRDQAQAIADEAQVGEGIGYYASEEPINAFKKAIEDQTAVADVERPNKKNLEAAITALKAAMDLFKTQYITFKPNVWYYIVNVGDREYAVNQAMYMNLNNASVGANINFGLYDSENDVANYQYNPYAMWRFEPIEGTDYVAIRNMATNHFIGHYPGDGAAVAFLASNEPAPFKIEYYSAGRMSIISADTTNVDGRPIHAAESQMQLVHYPHTAEDASSWNMIEVSELNPDNDFAIDMPVNSIRVVCLPFDLPEGSLSVMSLNKYVDAKTYGIHSLSANEESGVSLLGLELQTDAGYKAGTPFFLEVGDCTLYTDDPEAQEMATIVFVPTLTTDATAQTVNGLVGTLDGDTIKASGYGYIEKSALACSKQVGEEEAGLAIPGQQGYIDPKLVTNKEGNADLTLMVTEMLDGVNKVTVKKQAENAGIYSIDGKYLGTSAKNLQKGIYIVGKKKVAVK